MSTSARSEQNGADPTAALLPVKRSYAVVWSSGGDDVESGRLDPFDDRFDLCGRGRSLSIPLAGLLSAAIARGRGERLRGLPVLVLRQRSGALVRIASLEGAGALHELAGHVERAGLAVAV
jgi:hypothetical protein